MKLMQWKLTKRQIMIRLILLGILCVIGLVLLYMRACPKWKPREVTIEANALTLKAAEMNPCININGMTQETRILPPEGYTRTEAAEDSFTAFLRQQPLYPADSPIYVHDGSIASATGLAAVYTMDTGTANLQQCADSIIRLYSEYYWQQDMKERIAFHTTSGFLLDYPSWRDGKRALVLGNFVTWVPLARADDSYEQFLNYLVTVMSYAGTLSLEEESAPVSLADARVGDFFCRGGSPGHVILIVDEAVNADGDRCVLLGQGVIPAQSFHILCHDDENPWYRIEDITFPFQTSGYTFATEDALRRWNEGL